MLRLVKLILLAVLVLGGIPLQSAYAEFYLLDWSDQSEEFKVFSLSPELKYYKTDTNYDRTGNKVLPFNLLGYQRTQLDTYARWSFIQGVTLYAKMSWAQVIADQKTFGGESFGLTDQAFGGAIRVIDSTKGYRLTLQGQVDFPLYLNENVPQDGTPFLGDGTKNFTVGGFFFLPLTQKKLRKPWHLLFLEVGAGYRTRSGGFSPAVPWSGFAGYQSPSQDLRIQAGFFGLASLNQPFAGAPSTGNPCLSYGAGGSCTVGSTEPSIVSPIVQVKWGLRRSISVFGSYSKSIWGNAAPDGFVVSGGVAFRFGAVETLSGRRKARSNEGFVSYQNTQATVMRVNDRFNMIRIDKGRDHGLRVGQTVDIFSVDKDGTVKEAVARGKITGLKNDESALKIIEYYKEVWIEEGFVAKPPLN